LPQLLRPDRALRRTCGSSGQVVRQAVPRFGEGQACDVQQCQMLFCLDAYHAQAIKQKSKGYVPDITP
jgi:hypothetical protein